MDVCHNNVTFENDSGPDIDLQTYLCSWPKDGIKKNKSIIQFSMNLAFHDYKENDSSYFERSGNYIVERTLRYYMKQIKLENW